MRPKQVWRFGALFESRFHENAICHKAGTTNLDVYLAPRDGTIPCVLGIELQGLQTKFNGSSKKSGHS